MFANGYQNTTPDQLRSFVLDYLCHSYYTRTAKAFSKDSSVRQLNADGDEISTSPMSDTDGLHNTAEGNYNKSGDDISASSGTLLLTGEDNITFKRTLKQIEIRKEIRIMILSGRVDAAIELLDKYFPSVLLSSGSGSDADDSLSKKTQSTSSTASGAAGSVAATTSSIEYLSSTSTDPSHLLLNLRILSFCEACRTTPLLYSPPGASTSPAGDRESLDSISDIPSPSRAKRGADQREDDDEDGEETMDEDDAGSGDSDPEYEHEEQQMDLLTRARKLYAFTDTLPSAVDRATYHKELEIVAGLLAYPIPENSPISQYLSMERREAVADQINRAILKRTGLPLMSSLEMLIRNLHLVWDYAHQFGVKARPDAILPPRAPTKTGTSSGQDPNDNVVPPFDLRQFLDSKL